MSAWTFSRLDIKPHNAYVSAMSAAVENKKKVWTEAELEALPEDGYIHEIAVAVSNQYLRFGSSPRGAQTLILAGKVRALTQGRFNVSFDDLQAVAAPALRHRLILNFEAEAEAITTDLIVAQVLKDVPRNAETVRA